MPSTRGLETESPITLTDKWNTEYNFSYPDIKGLDDSLLPSKRSKLNKTYLGNAPWQKRCNINIILSA